MVNKLSGLHPKWEQNGRKCVKLTLSVFSFLRTKFKKLNKMTCHWLLLPQPERACAINSTWNIAGSLSLAASQRWYPYFTDLLTPWNRFLLEKLTSLQLVKKFPVFYGTRRFLTALKSARHLSLSRASPIQSSHPHPTSWRSILILSSHLRLCLPSGIFLLM
jgi:hypothetical protein